jgi:hypothetical protein
MDCAAFAREMADAALKDLELLPQDESEAPGVPGPQDKHATNYHAIII